MSQETPHLLLTEAYEQSNTRPYTDNRHPNLCTVERHVVSFSGEIRLLSSAGKGEALDTFEELRSIFNECAKQSLAPQTYANKPFAAYEQINATNGHPTNRKSRGDQYDVDTLDRRIVAIFSCKKAADLFYKKITERTSTNRIGNLHLEKSTYHVPSNRVSKIETSKNQLIPA